MKAFTVKAVQRACCVAVGLVLLPAARAGAEPAAKPAPIDPQATAPAERLGEAYASVAAHVMPSVVAVIAEKTFSGASDEDHRRGPSRERSSEAPRRNNAKHEWLGRIRGLGSGMILDGQGHVLTNDHVVRDASAIRVKLSDGRTFDAKVVGTDPQTDVAVLALTGTVPKDLPAVTLGDSAELKVGSVVLAIGAPFGLTRTVTNGIVSATGREDVGVATYEDLIQTDAPLNPGNSGGPLVNMRGEVIGMNTAIAGAVGQSAGINFAIPSNMLETLLPRLKAGEKIVRGTLGIAIQNLTPDLASHFGVAAGTGVLVSYVAEGSSAARAGVRRGDVIVSYGGQDVHDGPQLRNLIASTAPGTKATLTLLRNGKPMVVTASVGKLAEPKREELAPNHGATHPEQLGLTVLTLTPALASQFGIDVTEGVLVTEVHEGSLGADAGLEAGDVIVEVDRTPVATIEALVRTLQHAKDQHNAMLLVDRQGITSYVVLRW